MNINEIDKFRSDFFDKLIKDENEKENAKLIAQKQCFHKYTLLGLVSLNGYQERTCSKCNHSCVKSLRVWEGSKNGECIIA